MLARRQATRLRHEGPRPSAPGHHVDFGVTGGHDGLVLRVLLLATLVLLAPPAAFGQAPSVLHITVVLVDASGVTTPVANHRLLVSDNPPTAAPRLIITARDGTFDLKLRPGNYTVESDRPVAFQGKAYRWTRTLDMAAASSGVLQFTADNAEVESVASATTERPQTPETDPSFLMPRWQDSVVALWTPLTHASGFVVDASGLVMTNQRVIGDATTVEVQITSEIKVAASVLVADATRDVAVLWVDPRAVASVRPVPLACEPAGKPSLVDGQELFTIGAPLRGQKGMTSGVVGRVQPHALTSDVVLARGSFGGPVFTADGRVIGITSAVDDKDERDGVARVVRVEDACDVVASARKAMANASPPSATHLPVEPVRPFPMSALQQASKSRAGSLGPPQLSSSDFDIAFITPVLAYGAQDQSDRATRRPPRAEPPQRPQLDFSNWSEWVADVPPVLLVRVTPKLVESKWTTVARGAARTQGVALPPVKHVKTGLSRMRVVCGEAEVTPIHAFRLQPRVTGRDAVDDALYAFDPGALGPHCGRVTLVLYSEKEPTKGDSRAVDPKVLQQIWQEFAPYRDPTVVQTPVETPAP